MSFKAVPILRIFDEQLAKSFYIDYLGMKLDWEHRFEENLPIYMQVSKDDLILHLSEHFGDCSPGAKIFINTNQLDALFKEVSSKDYKHLRPNIEKAPWGTRTLALTDPFSNQLLFNESSEA